MIVKRMSCHQLNPRLVGSVISDTITCRVDLRIFMKMVMIGESNDFTHSNKQDNIVGVDVDVDVDDLLKLVRICEGCR